MKKQGNILRALCAGIMILLLCVTISGGTKASAASTKKYVIKVNKQMNCITIYKKNAKGKYKPVKAMICSTGAATPIGTFPLGEKMRWHTLMGPCYGQYCSRIHGGVLFHSVWYYRNGDGSSISSSAYNKLGTTASHGCVRLTVADAKWIYDNVPSGSKVIVYNSSKAGPLGKPKAVKLSGYTSWDPSDIWSAGNPWNNRKPVISGASNKTVKCGADFKVKDGVTAKNTVGSNATYLLKTKIKYNGKTVKRVNTDNPGIYKVTYYLTDEVGKAVSKTVKIRVKAAKPTPKIKGVTNLYVISKDKMTKYFALKNVKITQSGKTLNKKYVKVTFKKLRSGVYRVTYTAQRESLLATKTAKVYIDKIAPVISGIKNGAEYEVEESVTINTSYARSLITKVKDNYTSLNATDVKITIKATDTDNRYEVTYKVSDKAGNQTIYVIYLYKNVSGTATGGAITA